MCIHNIIHDVNPSFQGYNLGKTKKRRGLGGGGTKKNKSYNLE